MKIVATLLVRDEAELVADCLDHHLSQGVDAFLVTDHCSVDGLADVLDAYRDVIVDRWHETDPGYKQDQWVTRMARRAADFAPDWIVHLDADERWHGLSLLKWVPNSFAWVRTGPWRNHLPLCSLSDTMFRPEAMPYFEIPGRTGKHVPRFVKFGSGPGGKIVHRPIADVQVCIGNHWMNFPQLPCYDCDGITVHHYPIRSLGQFRRKVVNGAASLDAQRWSPEIAAHWRAWRDLEEDGQLDVVFQSFVLRDAEVRERLADGTIHLAASLTHRRIAGDDLYR
ncbi:MAG: glycosyltransferase family 2 protein [Planctomycetaceae bacterium]